MKKYRITYFMYPEKNIEIVIMARSFEEAVIYAEYPILIFAYRHQYPQQ